MSQTAMVLKTVTHLHFLTIHSQGSYLGYFTPIYSFSINLTQMFLHIFIVCFLKETKQNPRVSSLVGQPSHTCHY